MSTIYPSILDITELSFHSTPRPLTVVYCASCAGPDCCRLDMVDIYLDTARPCSTVLCKAAGYRGNQSGNAVTVTFYKITLYS